MDTPKKYLIKFDRFGCISDAACTAVYPERWRMNTMDGRAVLKGGEEKERGVFELECGEDELEKFVASASVCPTVIITVFDKETGKRIYPSE